MSERDSEVSNNIAAQKDETEPVMSISMEPSKRSFVSRFMRWEWLLVLLILLRLPVTLMLGVGHPTYRLDEDIAAKLQQRQQTLLPEAYRK